MATRKRPSITTDFIEICDPEIINRLEEVRLERGLGSDEETLGLLLDIYSLERFDIVIKQLRDLYILGTLDIEMLVHLRVLASFLRMLQDKKII